MHEDILNFNWNNEILNQKKIEKKRKEKGKINNLAYKSLKSKRIYIRGLCPSKLIFSY